MDATSRKDLLVQHDRATEYLRQATVSTAAQRWLVERLEKLQLRFGYLKKGWDKVKRHEGRLAHARKDLRTREADLSKLETEVQRLGERLSG